jgi:hypothetical protein
MKTTGNRNTIVLIYLLAGLLFSVPVFSQVNPVNQPYADSSYGVIIHKDPRIDLLMKKQAAINTAAKKSAGRTMRGYRLLVTNTSSRDEAIAAKTKIYTYFPDLNVYLTYQSPFFKLKAGNFQTRDDAKRYQQLMNTIFPKGVFIINDTIEVKPEKEPEE